MKAYALYYGPEPATDGETKAEEEERLCRPLIIQFGHEPLWQIPAREVASVELEVIQRAGFFVRDTLCEFAIEDLPGDKFTIVCVNHPGF